MRLSCTAFFITPLADQSPDIYQPLLPLSLLVVKNIEHFLFVISYRLLIMDRFCTQQNIPKLNLRQLFSSGGMTSLFTHMERHFMKFRRNQRVHADTKSRPHVGGPPPLPLLGPPGYAVMTCCVIEVVGVSLPCEMNSSKQLRPHQTSWSHRPDLWNAGRPHSLLPPAGPTITGGRFCSQSWEIRLIKLL